MAILPNSILVRRSVSSVRSLTKIQRNHRSHAVHLFAAVIRQKQEDGAHIYPFRHYSSEPSKLTTVDENLLKVVKSKIERAVIIDHNLFGLSESFPFEIEDSPGQKFITLRRTFNDEEIEVVADRHAAGNDKRDGAEKSAVAKLIVSVSQQNGFKIEFECVAYLNDISVQRIGKHANGDAEHEIVCYYRRGMDSDLKKSVDKYLEMRGIDGCFSRFLNVYLLQKDERDNFLWWKKLETFIET